MNETTKSIETIELTETSKQLFIEYANDAADWNGMPLVGGNVTSDKALCGNLTHLKKAGLLKTKKDEEGTWVIFTDLGREYAKSLGIEIMRSW